MVASEQLQNSAAPQKTSHDQYTRCRFDAPCRGWEVGEDLIHLRGNRQTADLVSLPSVKKYRDFELVFQWRVESGGNSGVIYRAIGGRGLEYQVVDDESRWATRNEWSAGAIYDLVKPSGEKACKSAGEWNTGRIVAVGNHVEHWLNGVKIVDFDLGGEDWERRYKASKYSTLEREDFGRVGSPLVLQNHGNPAWFRNIRVRKLDPEVWLQSNVDQCETAPLAKTVDP